MVSAAQPVLPPIDSPPPIDIPALAPPPSLPVSESDASHHPSRPPRQAHSNVLARLQALFPSHPSPSSPHPSHLPPVPPPLPPKPIPKFIKVRILTWNMHDSLPKGDCQDLLGSVPSFAPSPSPPDVPPTFPTFPLTPDHPHHLVIVAGQECPSASGIPMALGAGFKLNNKDNSRSRHSLLPDPDEPPVRKSAELDLPLPVDKTNEHHHPPSSWSSILENWYSHTSPPPSTSSDLNEHSQIESPRLGPYELLIKERMMGLYLAVFIHREARPFVKGMSKSAVTTGLIGGRVGNKGGVGVSINLDDTTLLFINAHLAAHEGKVNHRLADLAKIKAELAVEDFLAPSDPRFMTEDITDRFDAAFIFGDLNFRLDLTRLHADWLVSRKEYEQALEFDQLRKVMAAGDSFEGFNEAPIRFPPTFKYDVSRTLSRRSRYKSFKRTPGTPVILSSHGKLLSELAEHEKEPISAPDYQQASQQEREAEDDGEPDAMSVASSAWMSIRSRRTVDQDDDDNDADDDNDIEDDQDLAASGDIAQSPSASASASNLVHKMWSVTAAHKAKEKWVSLFSANSPRTTSPGNKKSKWRQSWSSSKSPTPLRRGSHITPAEDSSTPQTPIDPADPRQTKSGRVREFQTALLDAVHARPHKHLALSENNVDLEDEDKGVYDSSHKQRVPSWCDRILWKSTMTLELDQDSEDTDSTRFMPLRAKMGQIFNALKHSSMRSRRDSTWSMNHPDLSQTTPVAGNSRDPSIQPLSIEKCIPIPPRVSPSIQPKPQFHRRLSQARSMDSFQRPSGERRTSLTRVSSLEPSLTQPMTSPPPQLPQHYANTISPIVQIPPVRGTSPTLPSSSLAPSSPLDLAGPAPTPPSTSAPVFRWLLPFLYKDVAHQGAPPSSAPSAAGPPPPPPPKRGDITCLMYDTLDDKGMRRLEGRSDHRPVIGSYALYI